jgi:hypothetical protein
MAKQGNIEAFFSNLENADRLNGLVEDIRNAMLDYQVCLEDALALAPLTFALDFSTARYL